jgi:UDP-glucuronate 4-epimerase
MSQILVTGAAGFIGFHLAKKLLASGHDVVGIDNLNSYYDVDLKKGRLALLTNQPGFHFIQGDIANQNLVSEAFRSRSFKQVVNLAAQVGVRASLTQPHNYIESNIYGFLNILEACRSHQVNHLVYASSSSVYGANTRMPYSIHHNVDHPISLYAATKKANELMAHSYSHLYRIPTTGLRFFTVYGPWGRPDMAVFLFTQAIFEGKPIKVFNSGKMLRDFTYIDDIVEGIYRVIFKPATPNPSWIGENPDPGTSAAPYRLYNIGNRQPVELNLIIQILEELIGKKAVKTELPIQPGDVLATCADTAELTQDLEFKPETSIEKGLKEFVNWFEHVYRNNSIIHDSTSTGHSNYAI